MSYYVASSLAWSFLGIPSGVALGYALANIETKVRKRREP